MSNQKKKGDGTGCGWLIIFGVISLILVIIGLIGDYLEGTVLGYFIALFILFWVFSKIFDQ